MLQGVGSGPAYPCYPPCCLPQAPSELHLSLRGVLQVHRCKQMVGGRCTDGCEPWVCTCVSCVCTDVCNLYMGVCVMVGMCSHEQ